MYILILTIFFSPVFPECFWRGFCLADSWELPKPCHRDLAECSELGLELLRAGLVPAWSGSCSAPSGLHLSTEVTNEGCKDLLSIRAQTNLPQPRKGGSRAALGQG